MKKLFWIVLFGAVFAFYWFALRKDKTALAGVNEEVEPQGTIMKGFPWIPKPVGYRDRGTIMEGLPWTPKRVTKYEGITAFIKAEITEGRGFICPDIGKEIRSTDRPYIAQRPYIAYKT